MDDVVIGSHVPNVGFFTDLTDTSLVGAPLVGTTSSGMLTQVFLGDGLEIVTINNQKVLIRTGSALPTGYGEGPYSEGSFGQILSE
ncbi:MAG TPA: hypothetical protein VG651_04555 [Stellaceae bacterium]|nr:hypothetical protein [Stellaceae bacterium]